MSRFRTDEGRGGFKEGLTPTLFYRIVMTGYTTVTTISTYYVLFVPVSMHLALKPSWQVQHVVLYIVQSLVLKWLQSNKRICFEPRWRQKQWNRFTHRRSHKILPSHCYTQVRRFSLFNPREVLFVSFFVRVLRQVISTDESVCFPCAQASWDLEWRTSAAVWATEFTASSWSPLLSRLRHLKHT